MEYGYGYQDHRSHLLPDRGLIARDAATYLGYSKRHLARLRSERTFPEFVRMTPPLVLQEAGSGDRRPRTENERPVEGVGDERAVFMVGAWSTSRDA